MLHPLPARLSHFLQQGRARILQRRLPVRARFSCTFCFIVLVMMCHVCMLSCLFVVCCLCSTMNSYQRAAHDRQHGASVASQKIKRQHVAEASHNVEANPIEDMHPSPPSAGTQNKQDKSQSGLGMILNADKLAL